MSQSSLAHLEKSGSGRFIVNKGEGLADMVHPSQHPASIYTQILLRKRVENFQKSLSGKKQNNISKNSGGNGISFQKTEVCSPAQLSAQKPKRNPNERGRNGEDLGMKKSISIFSHTMDIMSQSMRGGGLTQERRATETDDHQTQIDTRRVKPPIQKVPNPGPGAYEPKVTMIKERIKSPIMKRGSQRFKEENKHDMSPGPGEYYRDEYFGRNSRSITLKGKLQTTEGNEIPGPGSYEPSHQMIKQSIKNVKMSSSQRPHDFSNSQKRESQASQSPGPGQYSFQNKAIGQDSLAFSLGGKDIKSAVQLQLPGPGSYDPLDVLSKSTSPLPLRLVTPGKPPRKDNLAMVGPGTYDQMSKTIGSGGPKFSMLSRPSASRGSRRASESSPGPGEYNPSLELTRHKNPEIQLKGRLPEEAALSSARHAPGPGSYDVIREPGKDARKIMMHGKIQSKNSEDVPGPGSYDARETLTKDTILTPNIGSGSKREFAFKNDSPGPGEYEIPNLVGKDGPMITLKPRIENQSAKLSPGPGSYQPSFNLVRHANPTYKFEGTPQAIDRMRQISQIAGNLDSHSHPGPGSYDPSHKLVHQSLAFSLLGRLEARQPADQPGPGAYDPNLSQIKHRDLSFDFSKSPDRTNLRRPENPGPGHYEVHNINDQALLSGHQAISYSFGRRL